MQAIAGPAFYIATALEESYAVSVALTAIQKYDSTSSYDLTIMSSQDTWRYRSASRECTTGNPMSILGLFMWGATPSGLVRVQLQLQVKVHFWISGLGFYDTLQVACT